jgi:hypothetical protein
MYQTTKFYSVIKWNKLLKHIRLECVSACEYVQSSLHHHFLKGLSFLQGILLALFQNSVGYKCVVFIIGSLLSFTTLCVCFYMNTILSWLLQYVFKSGIVMMTSACSSLLKIMLASLALLCFHVNFRLAFSRSMKKVICIMIRIILNL